VKKDFIMMLHPATVHFAIVLPVVASVFGLLYLIRRDEFFSKITARTTLIAAVAMIVAWYSGSQAGPEIFEYLSKAGKNELLEHKEMGLYLAIALFLTALLQIIGCKFKKFSLQLVATFALILIMLATFLQGKDGGEIVYKYGQPFKATQIEAYLNEAQITAQDSDDCDEGLEAYEDALDNIDLLSQELDVIYGSSIQKDSQEDK
jgi:uncharacterized membrane protein